MKLKIGFINILLFLCTCRLLSYQFPSEFSYDYAEDSYCNSSCCEPLDLLFTNSIFIGPEIYHAQRNREGGTKQNGWIYGVRAGYQHLKRNKFYWDFEALYGKGTLSGKNGNHDRIRSIFTDANLEGRFGYTFAQKCDWKLAFTPYFGIGYALEKNNFVHPTPIPAHFRLHYSYGCLGFLSQANWNENFVFGLNFKTKYLFDVRNDVKDREFGCFTMMVKEKMHYRVEIPLTYLSCGCWLASVVPFYEFRHYGKHANYPFDFLDTRFNIYGVTLKIITGW